MKPIMTVADLERFIDRDFDLLKSEGDAFRLLEIGPGTTTMRLEAGERHLRPGGTVSGPTMFLLADVTAYLTILAHLGPDAAHAVTTNLSINFLRKPEPGGMVARGHLLKLGKRLAVVEISIASEPAALDSEETVVSHAVGTYSIPQA